MLELDVILDFACWFCRHSMGVTLKCEGEGLVGNLDTIATVKVPCPTCGEINQIYFKPNGTLHEVTPARRALVMPEPSFN